MQHTLFCFRCKRRHHKVSTQEIVLFWGFVVEGKEGGAHHPRLRPPDPQTLGLKPLNELYLLTECNWPYWLFNFDYIGYTQLTILTIGYIQLNVWTIYSWLYEVNTCTLFPGIFTGTMIFYSIRLLNLKFYPSPKHVWHPLPLSPLTSLPCVFWGKSYFFRLSSAQTIHWDENQRHTERKRLEKLWTFVWQECTVHILDL